LYPVDTDSAEVLVAVAVRLTAIKRTAARTDETLLAACLTHFLTV
jgi:hypothetical protein